MVPVIHVLGLPVFSKLFAAFLVHHLWKRLPSGTTAIETNMMQCVVYGLSTERLTPHTPLTFATMLVTLLRLFPKDNLWI